MNTNTTVGPIRAEWIRLAAELQTARDDWGWDDPRTIDLEVREAEVAQRSIILGVSA